MQILVVDDHPAARDALEMCATALGFEARSAENGADALRALHQREPDVLVTDLEMPEMTGVELIKKARALYPKLPVVAISAAIDSVRLHGAAAVSAGCRLQKPFTAEQLQRAINNATAHAF